MPDPACPGLAQEADMSTALVPMAPSRQAEPNSGAISRPCAPFLAHLIATAHKAPQTRMRRRAEPGEAIASYAALGQWPMPSGRALSRSL